MSQKPLQIAFFLFLSLVISPLALAENQTKPKITLVADIWCPYNCAPDSEKPGYMVEMAKLAFGKHNIDVDYKIMPWARAIEDAKANKYNGIIGAYYRDAPDFIYPKLPQGKCENSFYISENNDWIYNGIPSLNGKKLGVVSDYSYSEELDAYIETYKKDSSRIQTVFGDNATENNIKKLVMGRIDVIVEDTQVIDYYLTQNNLSEFKNKIKHAGILPDSTDENGIIFIAFPPNNPESKKYAKILSDETKIMRENGELKKILDKYGIEDFEGNH